MMEDAGAVAVAVDAVGVGVAVGVAVAVAAGVAAAVVPLLCAVSCIFWLVVGNSVVDVFVYVDGKPGTFMSGATYAGGGTPLGTDTADDVDVDVEVEEGRSAGVWLVEMDAGTELEEEAADVVLDANPLLVAPAAATIMAAIVISAVACSVVAAVDVGAVFSLFSTAPGSLCFTSSS